VTGDLDIVPDPDPANLERLATALSSDVTAKKAADSTDYLPHPDVRPEEFFAEYFAIDPRRHGYGEAPHSRSPCCSTSSTRPPT